jgi:hypothetical protein
VIVDPLMLNSRRFIDVISRAAPDPIDPASIPTGQSLVLAGTALNNVKFRTGSPFRLYGDTYRYFFEFVNSTPTVPIDSMNPTGPKKPQPMFQNGDLRITFQQNAFRVGVGAQAVGNLARTLLVVLDAARASTASTSTILNLGPLQLENPGIGIQDIGFADGKVILTVAIGLDAATLRFGGGSGPGGALSGILATFDLAVGLPGDFSVSTTGRFSLSVANLLVEVPGAVRAEARGIQIQYDRRRPTQELVIASAALTFLAVN